MILIIALLSACVSLRDPGYRNVARIVKERTGHEIVRPEKITAEKISDAVKPILAEKLSADDAIKIALLNNRQIHATFQELGIAKSEVLQATLWKNPRFNGFVRIPDHSGIDNNTELEITKDAVDIILMPFKRRVAVAQYEQSRLRVTDAVLNLIAEVKTAYYQAQAAEQIKTMQAKVLHAAELAAELADRQFKAGNLKDVDLANEKAAYEQAHVDYDRSETAAILAREPLNRLLGLSRNDAAVWKLEAEELSELPSTDPALNTVEELASTQRLDLAAVRKETEIVRRDLLATRLGIIPEASAGLSTEKDMEGGRVTGPSWDVEVPVFDWKQAAMSRGKARLRQSQYAAEAFDVQVRSEARSAREHVIAARRITERYRDKIVPLRKQIVELSQPYYNFMLIGVYQLLQAKQNEILAYREYVEALKEYWIAKAELERVVGGKLPEEQAASESKTQPAPNPPPANNPQTMPTHHHGGKNQ